MGGRYKDLSPRWSPSPKTATDRHEFSKAISGTRWDGLDKWMVISVSTSSISANKVLLSLFSKNLLYPPGSLERPSTARCHPSDDHCFRIFGQGRCTYPPHPPPASRPACPPAPETSVCELAPEPSTQTLSDRPPAEQNGAGASCSRSSACRKIGRQPRGQDRVSCQG